MSFPLKCCLVLNLFKLIFLSNSLLKNHFLCPLVRRFWVSLNHPILANIFVCPNTFLRCIFPLILRLRSENTSGRCNFFVIFTLSKQDHFSLWNFALFSILTHPKRQCLVCKAKKLFCFQTFLVSSIFLGFATCQDKRKSIFQYIHV